MKAIAILAVALVALPSAAAQPKVRAQLSGYQEVPAVSTVAEGEFLARPSTDLGSVEFTLSYSGLQARVTQAHIHFAQTAVNGPIVVWLCGSSTNPGPAGTPACPQGSGTVSGSFASPNVLASPPAQQLEAGAIEELVMAMFNAAAYVNVHTEASPGGEIRGQIYRLPN